MSMCTEIDILLKLKDSSYCNCLTQACMTESESDVESEWGLTLY